MIRLVFMTDDSNMIGCKNPADDPKRVAAWPEGLPNELGRIFYGEHTVAGSATYGYFKEYDPGEKSLYILSKDKNFDLEGNSKAQVVTDYQELVERYRDSEDILVVAGGKTTWELFLPYASEMVVAYADKIVPGDICFSSWRDLTVEEYNRVSWNGGNTFYYKVVK